MICLLETKKYHLPDNVDEIFKELAKELITDVTQNAKSLKQIKDIF